jgi:hypothetical protein
MARKAAQTNTENTTPSEAPARADTAPQESTSSIPASGTTDRIGDIVRVNH